MVRSSPQAVEPRDGTQHLGRRDLAFNAASSGVS
jgi:hypothetical protein